MEFSHKCKNVFLKHEISGNVVADPRGKLWYNNW